MDIIKKKIHIGISIFIGILLSLILFVVLICNTLGASDKLYTSSVSENGKYKIKIYASEPQFFDAHKISIKASTSLFSKETYDTYLQNDGGKLIHNLEGFEDSIRIIWKSNESAIIYMHGADGDIKNIVVSFENDGITFVEKIRKVLSQGLKTRSLKRTSSP